MAILWQADHKSPQSSQHPCIRDVEMPLPAFPSALRPWDDGGTTRFQNPQSMKPLIKLGGIAALFSGLVPGLVTGSFAQTTLPASLRLTTGVDTNKPGFLVRTAQVEGIDHAGSVATSERLLNGDLGANIANLTDPNYPFDTSLGFFIVNQGLNFRHDAGIDADNGVLVGPDFPDTLIPGLPGTTGSSEQAAAEAIAFLEFPTAGTYEFGVSSDDAFKLTFGVNPETGSPPSSASFRENVR